MYIGKTDWFTVWANGKQHSGVYYLHVLPKNGCEGLKLVSKMALKKCNMNFRLEQEKQVWTTFSDVDSLFALMQHYPRSKFYLSTELFWKRFLNSKQPLIVLQYLRAASILIV